MVHDFLKNVPLQKYKAYQEFKYMIPVLSALDQSDQYIDCN